MPPLSGLPFVPFKIAASAVLKLAGNNVYGVGALPGSLVSPASQKLRAIYDNRAVASSSGNPTPYWLWGTKSASPDGLTDAGQSSSTFHKAGIVSSITGHVFSGQQNSSDEADELLDRIVRLFHHQPLVIVGWSVRYVTCGDIQVIPDPIGHHGIITFRPVVQA